MIHNISILTMKNIKLNIIGNKIFANLLHIYHLFILKIFDRENKYNYNTCN